MKKETKYKIVTELEQALSQNNSFYLIDYKQMTAWEMVELRKALKRHGFQLKVVKNRLALRPRRSVSRAQALFPTEDSYCHDG